MKLFAMGMPSCTAFLMFVRKMHSGRVLLRQLHTQTVKYFKHFTFSLCIQKLLYLRIIVKYINNNSKMWVEFFFQISSEEEHVCFKHVETTVERAIHIFLL